MQDTLSPEMRPATDRAMLKWAIDALGNSSLDIVGALEAPHPLTALLEIGQRLAMCADGLSAYVDGAEATLPAKYFDDEKPALLIENSGKGFLS